ncbi:uncharacterized protein [Panulirus ornatus]|uniref:uncharacterized protein n=1 Tax=Panulirus ornatus TaxID=150431 RepID=UPI003A86666E
MSSSGEATIKCADADSHGTTKLLRESQSPATGAMMMTGDAGVDEVRAYLPDLKDKRVLLLGAGIRQNTEALAQLAGHLTLADHNQDVLDSIKTTCLPQDHISFMCGDVTELEFAGGSFDLVFVDRLLTSLGDDDLTRVLVRILDWLTPGGYLFILETCDLRSGHWCPDMPTVFRSPLQYFQMLQATTSTQAAFTPIRAKSCLSYIQHKGDPSQLCILAERVNKDEQVTETHFPHSVIFQMEWLLGNTWNSTEGETTTREFCLGLGLVPGQRVLDVGSGGGESAFFMARYYGVHVHGVDLSSNMFCLALQRQATLEEKLRKRIHFEMKDILEGDYPAGSFDVIYSRNVLLYIHQKAELLRKFKGWLKPGGTLFITDYCRGTASPSQDVFDFENRRRRGLEVRYTGENNTSGTSTVISLLVIRKKRNNFQTVRKMRVTEGLEDFGESRPLNMVTVDDYSELMRSSGFTEVKVEDFGPQYSRTKEAELRAILPTRLAFLQEYPQEVFDDLVNITRNKRVYEMGLVIHYA